MHNLYPSLSLLQCAQNSIRWFFEHCSRISFRKCTFDISSFSHCDNAHTTLNPLRQDCCTPHHLNPCIFLPIPGCFHGVGYVSVNDTRYKPPPLANDSGQCCTHNTCLLG